MPPTDSELDAMLKASRPVTDARLAEDPQVSALLAEIGRGLPTRPRLRLIGGGRRQPVNDGRRQPVSGDGHQRSASGGGRWRPMIASAVAVAVAITIPVVVADRRDENLDVQRPVATSPASTPTGPELRTGRFGPLEDGPDRSEWLNLESPELPAAIEEFGRGFPLPPGGDWTSLQRPGLWRGQTQETSLRHALAAQARCQWMRYWKDSGPSGREAARKVLVGTRKWSVYEDGMWTDQNRFDRMLGQLEKGDGGILRKDLDELCDARSYFGEAE